MIKTRFNIKEKNNTFVVFENNNIILNGFPTVDMALHGLWVYMGSDNAMFYLVNNDGSVVLNQE